MAQSARVAGGFGSRQLKPRNTLATRGHAEISIRQALVVFKASYRAHLNPNLSPSRISFALMQPRPFRRIVV